VRISFVIPWFGRELGGGAETLCREYCVRLSAAGHDVEVLTTCSRDHNADWYENHHPAGRTMDDAGFAVERFEVDRGSRNIFGGLNERLMRGDVLSYREEAAFFHESINSAALVDALESRLENRAVVALPYPFGLTRAVVHAAEGRAILWPCLHDEGYAHMKLTADMFQRAAGVIFNAEGERVLARAMHLAATKSAVVGMGGELPAESKSALPEVPERAPALLYLGRRSVPKGFTDLCNMFAEYRRQGGRMELWVAGKGDAIPAGSEGVRDLGFLSEAQKWETLRKAAALVMPSRLESFSIALLEALAVGTPGLVNSRCAVTRGHVEAGRCGLHYAGTAEFVEAVLLLEQRADVRQALGENGRRYVAENFAWSRRIEALQDFLAEAAPHAS
jgi:glycosyltransferase involved in cell wall biosynthesis